MDQEFYDRYVFYARLRSSLIPYIYHAAHQAYSEGTPIMRPLLLAYEGKGYDGVTNAYMLGDSLYVGAFNMHLPLPEGEWIDYFTGKVYEGGKYIDYEPQGITAGALFVKSGSVFVTMKPQKYILEKAHDYIVNVYPAEKAGQTAIYEDDGFTFDYEKGGYALTKISSSGIKDGRLTLTVFAREGGFEGRPNNGHDISKNSIPKIEGLPALSDLSVVLHGCHPNAVTLAGEKIPFTLSGADAEFLIPADWRRGAPLAFEIEI